jgi:dTDP-4-dehydrorhamnose 3,5-epimerase
MTKSDNLFGVEIIPLQQIPDERGKVMLVLNEKDPYCHGIKHVYHTVVNRGAIKGWHGYKTKTLHVACVFGMVKWVMWDSREWSETYRQVQEIYLGEDFYQLVVIPPGIFNAFKGLGVLPSILTVCADELYDESKMTRLPYNDRRIGYDWDAGKNG